MFLRQMASHSWRQPVIPTGNRAALAVASDRRRVHQDARLRIQQLHVDSFAPPRQLPPPPVFTSIASELFGTLVTTSNSGSTSSVTSIFITAPSSSATSLSLSP